VRLFWKGDWFALLIVGVVFGLLILWKYLPPRTGPGKSYTVVIESARGTEEVLVTPNDAKELIIPGPLGDTIVALQGGKVFVVTSPCPDKVCMKMGKIPDDTDFIACVPNRVVLRLKR